MQGCRRKIVGITWRCKVNTMEVWEPPEEWEKGEERKCWKDNTVGSQGSVPERKW